MIELQTVLTYLTLISVPVGVLYHIMTLNNSRKNQQLQLETRQTQLFMNLYETWRSPDFRKRSNFINFQLEYENLEDFWEKYGPIADPDAFDSWASIAAFYQGIGVLVKKGMIDIEIVNELIGNSTIIFWEKMSPEIIESREKTQRRFSSTLWNDFEYLYEEILKFRENQ
jgi:hypothetical protein